MRASDLTITSCLHHRGFLKYRIHMINLLRKFLIRVSRNRGRRWRWRFRRINDWTWRLYRLKKGPIVRNNVQESVCLNSGGGGSDHC